MKYAINLYRTTVEEVQVFIDTDKEDPKAEIEKAIKQIGGLDNMVALHGENPDETPYAWEWSGDVHEADDDKESFAITQDIIDGEVVWDSWHGKYEAPVSEEEEDEEEYDDE